MDTVLDFDGTYSYRCCFYDCALEMACAKSNRERGLFHHDSGSLHAGHNCAYRVWNVAISLGALGHQLLAGTVRTLKAPLRECACRLRRSCPFWVTAFDPKRT